MQNNRVSDAAVPRLSPHTVFRCIEEEYIIVQARRGLVLRVNTVGGEALELVNGNRTIRDIAKELIKKYCVSEKECVAYLKEFFGLLKDKDVIVFS